jgi:hypothetical protein
MVAKSGWVGLYCRNQYAIRSCRKLSANGGRVFDLLMATNKLHLLPMDPSGTRGGG